MHYLFELVFSFSLDKYPEVVFVELLNHMMIIFLVFFFFFEESPYCFPQWLHQFTFPLKRWEK